MESRPSAVVSTCTHALISSRASRQSDFPAVRSWDGDFTYGKLEYLSSNLGAYLETRDVGPDVLFLKAEMNHGLHAGGTPLSRISGTGSERYRLVWPLELARERLSISVIPDMEKQSLPN
jgi:hypothetical protein